MENVEKWLPAIVTIIALVITTVWNIADRAHRQGKNSEKLDTVILRVAEVHEKVDLVKHDLSQTKLRLAEQGIKGLTSEVAT